MSIYDDYKEAVAGGEEWCPKCDEHYLPPWDYCKCVSSKPKKFEPIGKVLHDEFQRKAKEMMLWRLEGRYGSREEAERIYNELIGGKYGKSTKDRK